jgi:type II secretory pathway pseudopilin PulG
MTLRGPSHSKFGDTLIDALVVLVVVGFLSLAATLSYRGDREEARLGQAQADLEALAAAQAKMAELFGVYLPLQVLDDTASDLAVPDHGRDRFSLKPETLRAIDVHAAADSQIGAQPRLADRIAQWNGPYHQPKRIYVGGTLEDLPNVESLDADAIRRDWPLDPWGNPYRFYSPIGIIGTEAAKTDPSALEQEGFSDGILTTEDDRFDRYAIVSYGPDGLSDSVFGGDDDVIYLLEGEDDQASNRL